MDHTEDIPLTIDFIKNSLPFLFFALWGGAASYILKVKGGVVKRFSVFELLGDFVVSGFSGIFAYLIAHELELSGWMTAAVVGIAGHLGSQTVLLAERAIQRMLEVKLGVKLEDLHKPPSDDSNGN